MRISSLVFVVCFLVALVGCDTSQQPLKPFYFPPKHQVYVYSSNDSIGKEYWEVIPTTEGLKTNVYDGEFTLTQSSFERYYDNGINLEELDLQTTRAEIKSGFVYPFDKVDNSEVVFYHIIWQDSDQNKTTYELLRNRRFIGIENREILGSTTPCAKFSLEERIISDLDGSIEMKTSGIEYYAKGIGLFYRRRQLNDNLMLEQELFEVITKAEFDQLLQLD